MEEPVIQKIVVLLNFDQTDKILIENGIRLASIFSKGLCLVHLFGKGVKTDPGGMLLKEFPLHMRQTEEGIPISSYTLQDTGQNIALTLADRLEAIMVIAVTGRFSYLSKILQQSPVPFLFIDGTTGVVSQFRRILVPIDSRPQNKDSMLWPAFFARNNGSNVIALGAKERSPAVRHKVKLNLASLKNLLKKTGAPFEIVYGQKGSMSIQYEALASGEKYQSDLLILLGSGYITWFDLLIGLPEKKILKKAGSLPVLIVNPTKKNYLVCD